MRETEVKMISRPINFEFIPHRFNCKILLRRLENFPAGNNGALGNASGLYVDHNQLINRLLQWAT
jgi:hypothetical protein